MPDTTMRARLASHARSIVLPLALLVAGPSLAADEETPSGTVRIEQYQVAFIGSGNLGGGTLQFQGKSYPFTVGGLGIGGFGISKITATGDVYHMREVRDFAGTYVQGRVGFALADISRGGLWLQNTSGVVLHLKAQREGLALSLGGDAVYIGLD